MDNSADARPIFVMGCPRSGTTLLQLMLHRHSRIAIPPENRFVLSGYLQRREVGDLRDAENRARLAAWIVDRRGSKFTDLGLDADAVRAAIMSGPPTLGGAFATVLQAYAERFGKPRWGDKRPAHLTNVAMIRRLFPTAQLVTIVRDGRSCVASLKEMPWHRRKDVASLAAQWAYNIDCGRRAARKLPADSYYELRYEDLVAQPAAQLRKLCDYLGERFEPAMTEPAGIAPQAVPRQKTWHDRTRQAVAPSRSWRTRLTPEEIAFCETVLAGRLRLYSYPVEGPKLPVRQRLEYVRPDAERRVRLVRQAVRDLLRR
jgi:hypothetical protein